MHFLKGTKLGFGLIFASMFLLTACNTIEGTAEGAGKDIQAASNAIDSPPHHKTYHHKKMTKKTMHINKNSHDDTSMQQNSSETDKSY